MTGAQTVIGSSVILGTDSLTTINNSGATPLTNIINILGMATDSNQAVIGNSSITDTYLYGTIHTTNGVTKTCTVAPTGMTIVGGIITAVTGGTCTP